MLEVPIFESLEEVLLANITFKIIGTILVIGLLLALRRFVFQTVGRKVEDLDAQYFWRQIVSYAAATLGALIIIRMWFAGITSILTLLSLVAAALTIANKEVILNLTAWPVITWRRLFGIGDRIKIGTQAGDVTALGILYFTLAEIGPLAETPGGPPDQHTGRMLKIPNSVVFTQALTNYSRSVNHIWNRIDVVLTPESRWEEAEQIALGIAAKHQSEISTGARQQLRDSNESIVFAEASPTAATTVRDGKVVVTVRYLCRPRKRHATEKAFWRDLLKELEGRDDIALALST